MAKTSKRYKAALEAAGTQTELGLKNAIEFVKNKLATAKFDETVELSFCLGVDARKSDQIVRGAVVLPHGIGKDVTVLVFAKGALADQAKEAGADYVGFDDLIEKISKGWFEFDAVIAAPDTMKDVGKLGKALGTKGLMPTPKKGTVTNEIAKAVQEAKAGRVEYRVDKTGNLHCIIGKKSFDAEKLYENAKTIVDSVIRAKPAVLKGTYIKKCSVCSSMGPSVVIDVKDLGN